MKMLEFIFGIILTPVYPTAVNEQMNSTTWYLIGALIVLGLLLYLVYALLKPENF